MKALLDACVLYPSVMRQMLLGAAAEGLFTPLWSARILEEWARATRKLGPEAEALARGEVALARAAFPRAEVANWEGAARRLYLADENDIHVLAAAVTGGADLIVTMNASDFPRHVLAEEGLAREGPDGFLWRLWSDDPQAMSRVAQAVRAEAERLSGEAWPLRRLMKKAQLPRLGKALENA